MRRRAHVRTPAGPRVRPGRASAPSTQPCRRAACTWCGPREGSRGSSSRRSTGCRKRCARAIYRLAGVDDRVVVGSVAEAAVGEEVVALERPLHPGTGRLRACARRGCTQSSGTKVAMSARTPALAYHDYTTGIPRVPADRRAGVFASGAARAAWSCSSRAR
jgi:hypothetical protein